ncbi:unnamed protein product [Prorocentrum cordatum]|uniref:Mitochondrial import inner membrane translocase subunit TIM23 n=1 Tax=Prorocentrum cordatum TaxID=2364126 RepID=A0ABN9VRV8_9DINO|nr:unnamed protein product [Polarella glacialis]
MSSSDYLSSGGVRTPEILAQAPRQPLRQPQQGKQAATKDELFLEGYGRQFGEKLTYSMGLTYGMGLLGGGAYGALLGLRQGGATPKLFVNSVLNSSSRYGPALGNQCAVITLFYVTFNNLVSWGRGADDSGNAAVAGGLAGALYKSASRSWQPVAKYSSASAVFFTALDWGTRSGYF